MLLITCRKLAFLLQSVSVTLRLSQLRVHCPHACCQRRDHDPTERFRNPIPERLGYHASHNGASGESGSMFGLPRFLFFYVL